MGKRHKRIGASTACAWLCNQRGNRERTETESGGEMTTTIFEITLGEPRKDCCVFRINEADYMFESDRRIFSVNEIKTYAEPINFRRTQ
jgi:hypothetical protein